MTKVELERKYPLIALREMVIFPSSLSPLFIARPFSLQAARHALSMDGLAVFFTQKDPKVQEPKRHDLYSVGVLGRFLQHVVATDGSIRAVVQGLERIRLEELIKEGDYYVALVRSFPQRSRDPEEEEKLARMVREYLHKYLEMNPVIPEEITLSILDRRSNPLELANLLSAHLPIQTEEKQNLLTTRYLNKHLENLVKILIRETEFLELKQEIEGRVRNEIQKGQKQFFLQQEIREIQKELGVDEEDEFIKLEEEILKSEMPKDVEEKALKELQKLKRIPAMSPESTVIRNYLDWLLALPWNKRSKDNLDIKHARNILDRDHYGLEEQKDRILEYLSVLKLKGKFKGQVICFVGPPGVGKTSLAISIAKALGRKFVRMSLGGLRDEAEIRGHRRTYVGALPGRIIQQIKRAGTKNPVFLLDEVDKVGMDFRGDPQAALMEVLDPEVNKNFQDNYLEVDFDLSEVLFITTANSLHGIPKPLLDRMEVIPIRGYLDFEKLEIARRHLVPKKMKELGVPRGVVSISKSALLKIIREYTREAGVRELERHIGKILRKGAKLYVEEGKKVKVTEKNLKKFLGLPKYPQKEAEKELPFGVAYGLAWTEYGGEVLRIEVSAMSGSGKLELTGSLGEVMKESAKAALSYIRSHYVRFGLKQDFYTGIDIHLHVPEGAIPKDGPSAGVPIVLGMISALTRKRIPGYIAATGEITLSGEVLPVGGLEEKLLAAKRSGIKKVFIPEDNKREVEEMKKEISEGLELIFISHLDQVVRLVFPSATGLEAPVGLREKRPWVGL